MPHQQANGCYIKLATLMLVLFDKVNPTGGYEVRTWNSST